MGRGRVVTWVVSHGLLLLALPRCLAWSSLLKSDPTLCGAKKHRWFSMTKAIVAAAGCRLAERGLLDLDDSLGKLCAPCPSQRDSRDRLWLSERTSRGVRSNSVWGRCRPRTQPANTRIRLSVRCNAPSPLPIRPPSPGGGKKGRKSHKTCFMQNLENHRKSTHPPTHLPTHRPPMLCAIWIGKPSGRSGRQPRARQGAVAVRL